MIHHNRSKETMLAIALVFRLAFGACYAAEDPIAVPTFHCIGLYWSPEEGGAEIACCVRYRPMSAEEWRKALPLWFDERGPEQHSQVLSNRGLGNKEPKIQHEFAHQYRGSIVNLRPGTEYEIELSLQGTDQAFGKSLSKKGHGDGIPMARARIRARTWSEDSPIGKTIVLPEISGETLVIEQSGSPDAYILYTAAPGKTATINGDNQIDHCISIKASYVIARGLTLKSPRSHAIRIYDGYGIVIEECDISGWGLPSSVQGNMFGKNMEAAVYAREKDPQNPTIQRVIVQRCRIHHPRYDTNSWGEYRKEVDPDRKATRWHPGGPQGVTMYNTRGNHVFRYNEIWSDAEHYYNDILGGGSNYSAAGFPNRDSDFYCNRLMHCWDDGIEAEGANCNVRIWGNYIDHTFVKIATAATHVGPLYIWRNVIGQSRANPFGTSDEDKRGPFLKAGSGRGFGGGRTYFFHNTFLQSTPPPGMSKPMGVHIGLSEYGGPMLNHVSRNNILHVLNSRGISISNKKRPELRQSSDFDYDLYNGRLQVPEGSESHGIKGKPIYDPSNGPGEFALAPDSPGYDTGFVLPNFNDDYTGSAPDIGAHESGTPAMQFGVEAYLYKGNLGSDSLKNREELMEESSAPDEQVNISIPINAGSMRKLPSQWAEYFGTHYASSPEKAGKSWNTVRSYGGTHVGIGAATGEAPPLKGPFAGKEVRISLRDFRSPRNPRARSGESLIPEIIENRITAIYLMTNVIKPSLEPFDKDLAYWTLQQIYEAFPEANRHVVYQIGNEVVSGHFDPKGLRQQGEIAKGMGPDGKFFGYDLEWKEEFYVNEYLAPAVEVIQRVSTDVYGNPHQIKTLLGSMNPYNSQNIEFLSNVMERVFDGKYAPTLAGAPVWKHIDVLTVHYMTGNDKNIAQLQEYHDCYLKQGMVSGIWITEDHGRRGKGPVTIVDRGLRFLSWVAKNGLSAEQTRLVWWGDRQQKPGGRASDAADLMGEFLSDRPLHLSKTKEAQAVVYTLADGTGAELTRILVAIVPEPPETMHTGSLRLDLPEGVSSLEWESEVIRYSASISAERSEPEMLCTGNTLTISLSQRISEPLLVLLRAKER